MSENAAKVKTTLEQLQATYGAETLKAVAESMLGQLQTTRQLPAEFYRMLSPEQIEATAYALDSSLDDIIAKGQAREDVYKNRGELVRKRIALENEIKTIEAEAIINGNSDGKVITWEDQKYPFNNDLARDAFRRTVSRDKRKELAEVEGEIAALEFESFKARDGWETVIQASESARMKARVQAHLLEWLSKGQ
ncbi:hypothetical protein [Paenibacillus sp. BK720]|uniref:hypothetical protein n=1 Tax=Paenibacillus sp. BK720 TaxID=2587092 RepID=UPI0014246FE1|nr:hypothetical protein [Paenibacillus sp. BK720]NIK67902.1 hypothetical protein [Paenibacillus sp. BK720]